MFSLLLILDFQLGWREWQVINSVIKVKFYFASWLKFPMVNLHTTGRYVIQPHFRKTEMSL